MNKKSKSRPRKSPKRPAAKKPSRPSGNVTPVKELERLAKMSDNCRDRAGALKIEGMAASHMLKPKPPAKAADKKTGGGLRPLGGAVANVVTLAGAMQDAIAKDKTGDMEAA